MIADQQRKIAILGFGLDVPDNNLVLAAKLGNALAAREYTLCAGGAQGTMAAALKAAKEAGGKTQLFLHEQMEHPAFADQVFHCKSQEQKHRAMAEACEMAIAIGGGAGSVKLANPFLDAGKMVLVLKNTGSYLEKNKEKFQFFDKLEDLMKAIK